MKAVTASERPAAGTFCWIELGTTSVEGAKPFYKGLFGWDYEEFPMGPEATYTMCKLNGLEVGGMYTLMKDQLAMNIPPHWLQYVAVEDADAAAARATELGGTVVGGPMDVFEHGRMAVIHDPQGAVFAVWQSKEHTGSQAADVPGTLCWSELATTDPGGATAFYTGLFQWRVHSTHAATCEGQIDYAEWVLAGRHIGGMLKMTEEWKGAPPHWMPYFQVSDCHKTVEKVKQLGGTVEVGPMPVPNVGEFALIRDPQGAYLSVIELAAVA